MHRLKDGKKGRHLEEHKDSSLKSTFKKLMIPLSNQSTRSSNKLWTVFWLKKQFVQNSSIAHKSYIFHYSIFDFFYLWHLIIMEKIPKKNVISRSLTGHLCPPSQKTLHISVIFCGQD